MMILDFTSKKEYIECYVDCFQSIKLSIEERADNRLKEFLVYLILVYMEGFSITSIETTNALTKYMNFKNSNEVYNYRKRLKDKGLLVQHKEGISLRPGLNLPGFNDLSFNFKLRLIENPNSSNNGD